MPYKVNITKQGRSSMKGIPETFDKEVLVLPSIKKVQSVLKERYGERWNVGQPVYQDTKKGAVRTGLIKSYWNKDWSHDTNKWFQTDWITLSKVSEKNVDFNKVIKKLRRKTK